MRRLALVILIVAPAAAFADPVGFRYATYFAMQTGQPGSMTGQMINSDGSTIGVSYSGHVVADSEINNQGSYYYTGYNGGASPYTNSLVANAPANTDIIALAGQTNSPITNTITFSAAVVDPIMDIVSLGQQGQASNYDFNTSFTILSQGTGYFGGFGSGLSNPFGNRLQGLEGDGVIQFKGTFTSISFTASPAEYWGGFNVGVQAVPEPASVLAISAGLMVFLRRKKCV
jgi:hypothetical protein